MTDDVVARAQAAQEGIAEGPWSSTRMVRHWSEDGQRVATTSTLPEIVANCTPNNANFIAAARALVPELVAELVSTRAEVERLRADLWRQSIPARVKIPFDVRARVFERDEHRCQACGATDDLSLDHIQPWSKGGKNTEDNLRVLCRSCNSARGNRIEECD